MQQDKLAELVLRLHERTKEGRVHWEEATLGKGYEASFPGYTVGVGEEEVYDHEIGEDILMPNLTIYNDEGKAVEQILASQFQSPEFESGKPNFYAIMREIHEFARRAALGADKAVDALLDALR